jgi:signal transduction histidine kinase
MLSLHLQKQIRPGTRYGALAYGSVILACYAGFLARNERYFGREWTVPVVFGLGAIFAILGVLGGSYIDCRRRTAAWIYFPLQCAIVAAILFLSPIRGYMGILVLPVLSQAIFDLRPRYATVVGLFLFAINVTLWAWPFGWDGAWQAIVSYGTGFVFTAVFTAITKQAINSREREEKLRQEVEAANRQLREYATQVEELATTRERNRLAREIHDGVGHYLTVVKTQLDAAAALMPTQPDKARDAVHKASKLTGDALDDVRRSVGALRADTARPPLPEALQALTHEAGLPVTVRVEGPPRVLPPGVEHALFRSAQEGLTNIRKHAAASAAEVALDFRAPDRVALAVTDNGRGRQGKLAAAGFGLRGIQERIEILGGHVDCGNGAEGGFRLNIEVPA